MKTKLYGSVVSAMVMIGISGWTHAGSLEKYQPPPIQQSVPNSFQQKSLPSTQTTPNLPIYQDFKNYAATLQAEQISKLITTYDKRKSDAINNKDWDQAAYYTNLINILLSKKKSQ